MIRVPFRTWFLHRYKTESLYHPYMNSFDEIPMPSRSKYHPGDVVVVHEPDDEPCVGVVLGCIDNVSQELRTDARGMVCFDYIRPATKKDLRKFPHCEDILKYLE